MVADILRAHERQQRDGQQEGGRVGDTGHDTFEGGWLW